MNKSELIKEIAARTELKKTDVEKVINAKLDILEETLKKGETVSMTGYYTFSTATRAARKGVNPATGAKMDIPQKEVVKVKVGAKLKLD